MHEVARADGKGTRPTNLRDARKLGLYPSVTNVLSVLARPGLDAWKQEQAILAALTLPRRNGETVDEFARRVVADMSQQVRDAADLGSAIHRAIELYAQSGAIPEHPEVARLFEPAREWFDREVEDVHAVEAAVSHVWDPLEAPSRFRAFLAARQLWVFTRGYCPVADAPSRPDDEPPPAPVPVAR